MRRVRSQFLQAVLRLPSAVPGRGVSISGGAAAGRSSRSSRGSGASAVGVAAVAAAAGLLCLGAAPASAADCPNAAIRAAQGPAVEALPDCMGLEMVSPPRKFSQGAGDASVSVDGGRVFLRSRGALGDPPGQLDLAYGDSYVATRGALGWSVESLTPSAMASGNFITGWSAGKSLGRSLSPDFSRGLMLAATNAQSDLGVAQAFQLGLGGAFSPLSPLLVPDDGALHGRTNVQSAEFEGAAADHSRLFFKPGDLGTAFLPGDPVPLGSSAERNGYVAGLDSGGGPGLALLARDWTGKVWGGRCGSRLGGVATINDVSNGRDQGAVSGDGSRALFMTRPGQTGAGACDGTANRLRIMRRVETGYGPEISQLVSSECDRVAPACDTTDGDDLFQGASVDQSKVYFLSSRQLTDSDLDGVGFPNGCQGFGVGGCDLYLYDSSRPVGERLTQVSAGDETNPTPGSGAGVRDGIAAISGDGSHVYFAADGVLTTDPSPSGTVATVSGQPNLYLYQRDSDHPDGRIAFLGKAVGIDNGVLWGAAGTFKSRAYPVPVNGEDGDGNEVGGDGHILVFRSSAPFTTDDADGGFIDVFRYDADAHKLVRVSKAETGGSDNGSVDVANPGRNAATVGTAFAEIKRWVSEDGNSIVLQTAEGLASDDANALSDDYLWRGGDLHRLPGTSRTQAGVDANYASATALSHDGSVVAFEAFERLLAADGDAVSDVYVARAGGGFAEPPPSAVCAVLADGCQGGGFGSVSSDAKTSSSSQSGNAAVRARKMIAIGGVSAGVRRKASRSGRLSLTVRASRAGLVRVRARAKLGRKIRRVGGASKRVRAGKTRVALRLSPRATRALREGKALRLTVEVRQAGARPRTRSVLLPGVES
jgi:hypothetical protein